MVIGGSKTGGRLRSARALAKIILDGFFVLIFIDEKNNSKLWHVIYAYYICENFNLL